MFTWDGEQEGGITKGHEETIGGDGYIIFIVVMA